MTDTMKAYEEYMADAEEAFAIRGTLLWSCDVVGGQCPLSHDPYAICQGDGFYGDLVTGFMESMKGKVDRGDGGVW